ncbi:MAG: 50S ribosomal protein L20 [bacterium]
MSRVKRGVSHVKKRRNLKKLTKGYKSGQKTLMRQMKTVTKKAGVHSYRDRKKKKRNMRQLWQIKLNAAVREHGLSYSKFIDQIKKHKIELDRKVMADLAQNEPKTFQLIIDQIKK